MWLGGALTLRTGCSARTGDKGLRELIHSQRRAEKCTKFNKVTALDEGPSLGDYLFHWVIYHVRSIQVESCIHGASDFVINSG